MHKLGQTAVMVIMIAFLSWISGTPQGTWKQDTALEFNPASSTKINVARYVFEARSGNYPPLRDLTVKVTSIAFEKVN